MLIHCLFNASASGVWSNPHWSSPLNLPLPGAAVRLLPGQAESTSRAGGWASWYPPEALVVFGWFGWWNYVKNGLVELVYLTGKLVAKLVAWICECVLSVVASQVGDVWSLVMDFLRGWWVLVQARLSWIILIQCMYRHPSSTTVNHTELSSVITDHSQ